MAVTYNQLCSRCRKNYVKATWRNKYVTCYDCDMKGLEGEIKDPKMKKMFDIPLELYKENAFLRSIKKNYLLYKNLSDKQVDAFKKAVKELKAKAKEELKAKAKE